MSQTGSNYLNRDRHGIIDLTHQITLPLRTFYKGKRRGEYCYNAGTAWLGPFMTLSLKPLGFYPDYTIIEKDYQSFHYKDFRIAAISLMPSIVSPSENRS